MKELKSWPSFTLTWRHNNDWPVPVPCRPPGLASKWPDIIFDVRIEILTIKNIHLDIHEGILECDFHICTWPASRISLQRPLLWSDIIFDMRIEILTLKNTNLDIYKGILGCDLDSCTWLASRISLQWPPNHLILFLM